MMGRTGLSGKVQVLPLAMILVAAALGAWGIINRYAGSSGQGSGAGLNVLLITLDTTRADRLGCYGYEKAHTPHLDRLAREGVRFDQCVTCVPITLPAHASILTGTYPFVHGARNNGGFRLADESETLTERLKQAGYATGAFVAASVLNRQYNLVQGFDVYVDLPEPPYEGPIVPSADARPPPPPSAELKANELADRAIDWLRTHAANSFFLWVHFYDPHWPYEPPPDFAHEFPESPYDGEIAFMDEQIGRILAELKTLGVEQNTLVVAVADHGEGLGEHGEDAHGFFLYDTTLRVPFIVSGPAQLPAGRVVSEQVRTIDLAPTILDCLRLPALAAAEGVSLMPLVLGHAGSWRLEAYGETLMPYHGFFYSWLRCYRADGWKYILAPHSELYHVAEDHQETVNLLPARAEQAAGMRESLKDLIETAAVGATTGSSRVNLSAGAAQQLGAIGYATVAGKESAFESEIAGFEPRGPDPKERLEVIRLWEEGAAAVRRQDLARGEMLLRKLNELEPRVATLRGKLAQVLANRGKLDEAIQAYQEAIQIDPRLAPVHTDLGFLFRQAGRLPEAIHHFQTVVDAMPDDPDALYNLAIALSLAGRRDEATACLRRADEMTEGTSPQINYNLGTVLAESGQPDEAVQHFRSAVQLNPDYAEAHFNLGNVLYRGEHYEEAMAHYREALRVNPSFTAAAVNLGTVLAKTGQTDRAVECFYQVLRSDPGYRETYDRLFALLAAAGRHKEAVQILETGLAQHPQDASLARMLAWMLANSPDPQLRDGDRAVSLAEQVCRASGSNDPQALHVLSAAYAEAGRHQEALSTARKALELAEEQGQHPTAERIRAFLTETLRAGSADEQP